MGEVMSIVTSWFWALALFILLVAVLALMLLAIDFALSNIAKVKQWRKKQRTGDCIGDKPKGR
jgi:hypothetical protein